MTTAVDLFGTETELAPPPPPPPPPPARRVAHVQGDLFSGDQGQFFGQSDVFSQMEEGQ